jgi:hypothetical protein
MSVFKAIMKEVNWKALQSWVEAHSRSCQCDAPGSTEFLIIFFAFDRFERNHFPDCVEFLPKSCFIFCFVDSVHLSYH